MIVNIFDMCYFFISVTVREDVLSEHQCQNWFSKFRFGNFDLEDSTRSGRPIKADDVKIKALVDADRYITIREIANDPIRWFTII